MEKNINCVKEKKACCSCGICAGICPQEAISMEIDEKTGASLPHIHKNQCVDCGICLRICPGYYNAETVLGDTPSGHKERQCKHLQSYIGNISDPALLQNCTSGGIVSELIRTLLSNSIYDSAFIVNTNCYSDVVETERITKYTPSSSKSRYIAVSHAQTAKYILAHQEERIVIVAVGCAITGFKRMIEQYHLNRNNYLLIGLFCDKIVTYTIWNYFAGKYAAHDKLYGMDSRNKKNSGWPGDMLLYLNNREINIDRKYRQQVHHFFSNERCLYCTDKLNESADISVGDNYTNINATENGTSSIIVRTPAGELALEQIRNKCILTLIPINEIYESQSMQKKQRNFYNAKLKYQGILHAKMPCKDFLRYIKAMLRIKIGYSYPKMPWLIYLALKLENTVQYLNSTCRLMHKSNNRHN